MPQQSMFNKDYVQQIHTLSKENPDSAKAEIKKTLLSLDRSLLKSISAKRCDIPFINSWNRFVEGKNKAVDLNLLTQAFYHDQLFRAKGLTDKNYHHLLNGRWFSPDDSVSHCKKTLWTYHFNITHDYEITVIVKKLIINDKINKNLELAKLYSIQNINKIESIYGKNLDYKNFNEKQVNLVKEFFSNLDVSKLRSIKTMGYNVNFFNAWNSLIKGKATEKQWVTIARFFGGDLYMRKLEIKENVLELTDHIHGSSSDLCCASTGQTFSMRYNTDMSFHINQWESKVSIIEGKKYVGGHFVPMKPIAFKNKIYEKTIVLKTGNLIINDWFRCDKNEFSKAIENNKINFEINYTEGRVEQISHYAEKFNFVSVNVGNTCPSIFQFGNQILIGEGPESKRAGMVCTDLWNASIIEEEHFLNILVKSGITTAKAKTHLKEIKKVWTCTSIKVAPGTYKLSFMGRHDDFAVNYKKKNKVPKGIKPYFAFERIGD